MRLGVKNFRLEKEKEGKKKEKKREKPKSANLKKAERTAQWVSVGARGRCCPELFRVGDGLLNGIACAGQQ